MRAMRSFRASECGRRIKRNFHYRSRLSGCRSDLSTVILCWDYCALIPQGTTDIFWITTKKIFIIGEMKKPLSHLNGLRALEAISRHQSIVEAARELGVSPAAVGQQVHNLEEFLALSLVQRNGRTIELTEAARSIAVDIRNGFDHLNVAWSRLQESQSESTILVTTPPSFAAKWLIPRLEGFTRQFPEIGVRLETSDRLVDFWREDIQIGVRYGPGGYDGLEETLLFNENAFPVCSPRLLSEGPPLEHPADLRHHVLIHDKTMAFEPTFPTWDMWLKAANVSDVDTSRGITVNSSVLATQAAVDGQGVALGRSRVVEIELRQGRLLRPFEDFIQIPFRYLIVHLPGKRRHRTVRRFYDWLVQEAAASLAD